MAMASSAAVVEGGLQSALRKARWRLIPLLAVCYLVAYMDRINISFAAESMNHDLHFTPKIYGLGAGLFFVTYALCEIPSNRMLLRFGARRWIARIMLTWGLLAAAMVLIRTPWSFYCLRMLLGVAEAGYFPGALFYLSQWFPRRERARAISLFYVAFPLSTVVMGGLAGVLLRQNGRLGIAGWQWLFLVEALPAIVLSGVVWFCLPDKPGTAGWLTETEREALMVELKPEPRQGHSNAGDLSMAFRSVYVWGFGLFFFFTLGSNYAVNFSLPIVLRGATGWSMGRVGGMIALIGVLGAASMVGSAVHSDRTCERKWHIVAPTVLMAVALLAAGLHLRGWVGVSALAFAAVSYYAIQGPMLSVCSMVLPGMRRRWGLRRSICARLWEALWALTGWDGCERPRGAMLWGLAGCLCRACWPVPGCSGCCRDGMRVRRRIERKGQERDLMSVDLAVGFAKANGERFVEELTKLLRIPSVSTAPEHVGDVRAAAEFVKVGLEAAGMENVRLVETSTKTRQGHPLVLADWLHAGEDKPTVLLYGHYDVQPAEPLDEWKSPPFEPEVRDGNIYGRGAVDDKGQMWMHVKALESLLKTGGKLPVNVRVVVEGEEEVGGEGIAAFVREHPEELKADAALVSDTEMFAPELPTLCVGLRGMIYTELEARGAATDLHSGMYGGAAPNPFVALAQMIAQIKRSDGHIAIPGFYDGIEEPTAAELEAWRSLPFDEEEYRKHEVGSTELTGEEMFSVLERTWSRPTMDVHGMPGGFIGAGAKTVIPAKAVAKISFRLVPGMKPEATFAKYKDFVESIVPKGITVKVTLIHSGEPIVVSTDNEYVRAATEAMADVFGKETVFVRGGGSIPIVGDFVRELGIPTVMMGFGLPDDNLHAPNEKFHLANFHRGIESIVRFLGKVGEA